MAPGITEVLQNFTSIEQVLPYLNNHQNVSMVEITNACDWALDPGFVRRDAIANFVLTLPRAQQQQLGDKEQPITSNDEEKHRGDDGGEQVGSGKEHDDEQECPLCGRLYEVASGAHFPVVLPCGHVAGATCLKELLKDTEICFDCEAPTATLPAARTTLTNPRSQQIVRGLLQSGSVFLEEKKASAESDKSFAAFERWAYGRGTDHDSTMARLHAKEVIGELDFSF